MKTYGVFGVVILALSIIGCGFGRTVTVSGADGSKATIDKSSDKVTISGDDGKGGKVTETIANNSMKVESSSGSMSMGGDTKVSETDLGTTFYPGSTDKANTAMKIDGGDGTSYSCVRETSDDPAKVIEFYKDKVKGGTSMTTGDTAMISGKDDLGGSTTIMASKSNGKTDIQYTHTVPKKK